MLDESMAEMDSKRAAGATGLGVSIVAAVVGLATSSLLVVDYTRPHPVFCSEGGGCEAVRRTAFAAPLGVPMPVFGVAGFLLLGVLALWPGARARLVQLGVGAGAGLVGLMLLGVQFRLGQVCVYCCVADACGLASALAAAARVAFAPGQPTPRPLAYAGGALLAAAVAVPMTVGFHASPVPPVIRAEIARTPKGEVSIVDFVDFECPFCRMTHAALEPLVRAHRDRIRLVRLQVPLHIHPHAMEAARAACCGERLGAGDEMADALFAAPPDELTRAGCEQIAQRIGLPLDSFRACVRDPATDARIEEDRAKFKAAGGFALPTLWIGETEIVGAQPPEALARALDDALLRAGS